MDEFINVLPTGRFESTNALWNELMLNDPWSVGYVTTLIETAEFKTKEEWEAFYYNSGRQRNAQLVSLDPAITDLLNNEQLVRRNKSEILRLDWGLKNLNYRFGRTPEQLYCKGNLLFQAALKRQLSVTEDECAEAVRFRTICQTWNGVIVRERKTVVLLKQHLPQVQFSKTTGETDYEFAVDYEVFAGGRLLCGIQIKPASYNNSKALYVCHAKAANKRKNNHYQQRFGVPVFDVFYEKGSILNGQVIDQIRKLPS